VTDGLVNRRGGRVERVGHGMVDPVHAHLVPLLASAADGHHLTPNSRPLSGDAEEQFS
jgi:hypothetical protein